MLNVHNLNYLPSNNTRVLVVDDSVVMRKILTDLLSNESGLEVVATAPNGVIALQRMAQFSPDVVTLDIEMPEMDGLATLREIKKQFPRTRVIMCSTLTERGACATIDALALGADDYVTKSSEKFGSNSAEVLRAQLVPKVRQFSRIATHDHVESTRGSAVTRLLRPVSSPSVRAVRPRAIAIGVSTGGPNALAELIPMLPKNLPVPVFVVQHMPPMFTRLLAERLQAQSEVRVVEAAEGMRVTPGSVYVAPGDFHMCAVRAGSDVVVQLNQDPSENSCRPAVDVLFRSVARVYGGATIGVILTGMGQDGLRGVEQLRALGAYIVAQDQASSVVWGMPGYVARAGLADAVCDLKLIAPEILRRL